MTIYNIHPQAGSITEIKQLLKQSVGLNKKEANDVINDVRELYDNDDIQGIRNIVKYINRNLDRPMVYYKDVNHWNRGTTNTNY
jgi:hypothetical protein